MTSPAIVDPATGELLDGRYRLVERVGEGGMARVYRAEDLHLQRSVALKIMRGPVDELGSVERARSETTLLAGLNHPALVTLYDARLSRDDVSYLVMELVDGITLRDLIARGPLDPQLAASLTADLAEALHVAHIAGIVHRDIKPSNVLLTSSPVPGTTWRPKLADFGIAYLRDSTRVTTPGLMVGTIAYLAPEQAEGAEPAPPADIYSFGIMLIEALSGARPFPHAEGIAALLARMTTPPPIPETLPDAWKQLLRGMTSSRPEDRPTALEVSTAAARIAGRAAAVATATDQTTVAAAAGVAAPAADASAPSAGAAREDETERTAVLPPVPPLPPARAAGDGASPPSRRRTGPRRIAIGAVAAVAGLLLTAGALFGVWSSASTAEPAPTGTTAPSPTEAAPSPTPTPTPEETAEETTTTTGGTGSGSSGSGSTNSNSGPGNNNGNGNGNSGGTGKSNGNGNGNG